MDDKVFNLLEKMYGELTGKIDGLSNEIKSIGNQVTVIEVEHGKKLDILFEELVAVKEKLTEHDSRFDTLESKIESQDVEIKVLKRVK